MKRILVIILGSLLLTAAIAAQDQSEINTILMRSTFKLQGKGAVGTAFLLGKPSKADPAKAFYVLVTAAHVLDACEGNDATLILRTKEPAGFARAPITIKIREAGHPLWVKHPKADVAAMYISIPSKADVQLVTTELLADDNILTKYEVHPGDQVKCLGYPYGFEANEEGFAILRNATIASYPIVPTSASKPILLDFNVQEGNSGGPAYFVDYNRMYGGTVNIGSVRFLMGLVSQQSFIEEEVRSINEIRKERHQLGLAVIVPAVAIKECIAMLPNEPTIAKGG